MPVISVISAFLAALALFWLIVSFTGDEVFSLMGTLVVLIFAAFIVGIGSISGFSENGVSYPFFPMMRRPIRVWHFLYSLLISHASGTA